jgi:integrase
MLAAAQPRISDEAAILVMGRLGLRKMEAAHLQARDVDLAHDLLYIGRAKGGKPAELPLVFIDVRQVLSLWLSEPGRTQNDYLIAAERGRNRPLTAPAVHRWFQRCCERAGLEGIKLHGRAGHRRSGAGSPASYVPTRGEGSAAQRSGRLFRARAGHRPNVATRMRESDR